METDRSYLVAFIQKDRRIVPPMWHKDYNIEAEEYYEQHKSAIENVTDFWTQQKVEWEADPNHPPFSIAQPEIALVGGLNPGQPYFPVILYTHLPGPINRGGHALYIEILDELGDRVMGAEIDFGWVGMQPHQKPLPVRIDKGETEPGGNVTIHGSQRVYTDLIRLPTGVAIPAGFVTEARIDYGDTDPPDNTLGHHSWYVVFKMNFFPASPIDPPPINPPPSGGGVELFEHPVPVEDIVFVQDGDIYHRYISKIGKTNGE